MAYNNKRYLSDRQEASKPADLAEKLLQGNIGKHAEDSHPNLGAHLMQKGISHAIVKEPGTTVNSLLGQGGGSGKGKK